MTGEAAQEAGRDGVKRAKLWLEATSRVDAKWVNPYRGADKKLRATWPIDGQPFSFDLGGLLRYEEFEGQVFYAEVKNYSGPSDLKEQFEDFLAKCYVWYHAKGAEWSDHFVWVTWVPHERARAETLATPAKVRAAVVKNAARIFPAGADLTGAVDEAACHAVSDRVWIIVLSEKQERLVPSREHLNLIYAHESSKEAAS
ncbi:MAG TPA: hypothetical protein VGK17_22065 [Propionicimonas sp.]|jgi:hypothetical protein